MDEPSAALDPQSEAIIIEIAEEQARNGKLVIVTSHRSDFIVRAENNFSLSLANS
jgi:ABC-type transport system involved in cytochrome bd biosynthesis fused ATPase/permease subunit